MGKRGTVKFGYSLIKVADPNIPFPVFKQGKDFIVFKSLVLRVSVKVMAVVPGDPAVPDGQPDVATAVLNGAHHIIGIEALEFTKPGDTSRVDVVGSHSVYRNCLRQLCQDSIAPYRMNDRRRKTIFTWNVVQGIRIG